MPPPPRNMPEPSELTRNSILRISEDKTIELIQEWERWDCLWNTNLKDYPNKTERNTATKAIAEKLNVPHFKAEHVAMKFKNLRNSYCQELRKMSVDKKYKPRVLWFAHMDKFLRPHLQSSKPYAGKKQQALDTITLDSVKTEIDSDDNVLFTEDWAIATSSQSDASCSNSILIESTYSERCPNENGESSNHSQAKKRKHSVESKRKHKEVDNEENKKNAELETEMPKAEVKKVNKPDYCDTFGTYVASLLRSLPKKKALMLQPKIVNLIVSIGIDDQSNDDSDSDS